MGLVVSVNEGGNFKPIEDGIYNGVCDLVVDRGEIETQYGPKRKVYIRFQLPEERVEYEKDGEQVNRPAVIGRSFTVSLSPKANLRKFLQGWRGKDLTDEEAKGFDLEVLLGKPATLVVDNYVDSQGNTRAAINSATRYKGKTALEVEGDAFFADAESSEATIAKLPRWLQEEFGYTEENRAGENESTYHAAHQAQEDDIPF